VCVLGIVILWMLMGPIWWWRPWINEWGRFDMNEWIWWFDLGPDGWMIVMWFNARWMDDGDMVWARE
jgi:hypothetical protein